MRNAGEPANAAAMHHGHALFLEQRRDEILVGVDRLALAALFLPIGPSQLG